MQLSYDYAKDRALMCLRANYESHLSLEQLAADFPSLFIPFPVAGRFGGPLSSSFCGLASLEGSGSGDQQVFRCPGSQRLIDFSSLAIFLGKMRHS